MAISVDHATKVITVNQSDCTLVSGTFYRLPTETVFRTQINALMDNEDEIWLLDPISHNTEYTVAGVTYSRKIEVINGFSITFLPDAQWTVELTESNNNLFDVQNGILNQNQVQVIPGNSAGLQTVASGSGLSAEQDTKLTTIFNNLDVVEGSMSHKMMMRTFMSVLCGTARDADTLDDITDSTTRIEYISMDGMTGRVIFDVNGPYGTRTGVALDAS